MNVFGPTVKVCGVGWKCMCDLLTIDGFAYEGCCYKIVDSIWSYRHFEWIISYVASLGQQRQPAPRHLASTALQRVADDAPYACHPFLMRGANDLLTAGTHNHTWNITIFGQKSSMNRWLSSFGKFASCGIFMTLYFSHLCYSNRMSQWSSFYPGRMERPEEHFVFVAFISGCFFQSAYSSLVARSQTIKFQAPVDG